jgi:adenylyltransferase/sulfurtransferase
MNDNQLLRYSRQIMLPQVDVAGQDILLSSKVLIIGLGGLGAPVAMYLAAAGIGELTLVDNDEVDLGNLQRQIIYDTQAIGQVKVKAAKERLLKINPEIIINTISTRLAVDALRSEISKADVVIDATVYNDNDINENQNCTENGVLAPVVGIIGSIQACEAIKILIPVGEVLVGKLLLLDASTMEWRTIKIKPDADCPVCGNG